jgi:putative membrane-bound dehydrogenase-like protein
MSRLVAVALLAALGSASRLTAADPTRQVKLNDQTFTLPAGFEIELIAGPPLTKRPIAAAFDDRGVLFVTEASGTNDPPPKQKAELPHTLLRLEDKDGDGKFESGGVFADKLMLPQGVMTLGDSVYVGHPPWITKFTGDQRETWFDGKTLTGCANDLHGPYAGPDGWIYWTKGAFAEQAYTLPTGKPFKTKAAHVFRAKPDGTAVEPVMTGGMDNPVDVVFTPAGERIFTTTFFQHPAGGKRDGLVHAVYGGVYGKDHPPVYDHPWTGPALMPVMTHMGAAAPCGLHRYESDQLGPDYRDNLFACSFNMHKVTRHVLVPDGATFNTVDTDFLVSDSLDFHPTDVIEDADGSLIVVDTGGWYKLCCPTSQLVKPDVLGGIYRIRKTGAHKVEDPRGTKIAWDKLSADALAKFLDDPRPAVRLRAMEALAGMAEAARPALQRASESASPAARRNALWATARTGWTAPAIKALDDGDESVRQVAAHIVGLHRDRAAIRGLCTLLETGTPHNKRAAAEALGRIGDEAAVVPLLTAHTGVTDRVLQHSLTYALIEIGDDGPNLTTFRNRPDPAVIRASFVALEGMGKLTPEGAIGALTASDPALREMAWWVVGRHPEWGDRVATVLRDQLRLADGLSDADRDELAARVGKFVKAKAVQAMLGEYLKKQDVGGVADRLVLRVMARSGLKAFPDEWAVGMAKALASKDLDTVRAGYAVLRAVPADPGTFRKVIPGVDISPNPGALPDDVNLAHLAATPPARLDPDAETLGFVIRKLAKSEPAADRALAAEVVAKAKPTPATLTAVAAALKTCSPTEVARLLPAFARSTDEAVGKALVAALSDPAVRPMVRTEQVKPVLDKYPAAVKDEAKTLYDLLDAQFADQRAKLEQLLGEVKGGDVRRGQVVFHSQKAACITCHAMGYLGGKVGPDLTKIGGVRTERDLLEAIVFPNVSFVRSYEPVKVDTLDGRTLTGILKADTPDEVVLAVSATEEVRVARKDIDTITPGSVSVMPSGLDQQLTKQELADLVAFLRANK